MQQKQLPAFWSHDLHPGPQRCVRKTFSTYFVTLNQWKTTLTFNRTQIHVPHRVAFSHTA